MCTVTILKKNNELLLTMNRDELKTREEGAPVKSVKSGIEICYPVDLKSQGTWIAISNAKVAACILNRYDDYEPESPVTRGEIIINLLELGELETIKKYLELDFMPEVYRPFTLLVMNLDNLYRLEWNGKKLEINKEECSRPLVFSSSSWKTEEVIAWRKEAFGKWLEDGIEFEDNIPLYHLKVINGKEAWTPLMERELVHTKNICQVNFSQTDVKLDYYNLANSNCESNIKIVSEINS